MRGGWFVCVCVCVARSVCMCVYMHDKVIKKRLGTMTQVQWFSWSADFDGALIVLEHCLCPGVEEL